MAIPAAAKDGLSDILFKLVLMALAFAAASLLLRDALRHRRACAAAIPMKAGTPISPTPP